MVLPELPVHVKDRKRKEKWKREERKKEDRRKKIFVLIQDLFLNHPHPVSLKNANTASVKT